MKRLILIAALLLSCGAFGQQVQKPFNGGTGISQANTKTITLGGPLVTNAATTIPSAWATLFSTSSSANLATAVTDETGSGALVFGTSPTIASPVITNIAPAANFTLTQNSVVPFTSVNAGAVANTLYLSAGNVGIGWTAPDTSLAVSKTSSGGVGAKLVIRNGAAAAANNEAVLGFYPASEFSDTLTGAKVRAIMTAAAPNYTTDLSFSTYNAGEVANVMRLTGAGNVGIGTTTPAKTVDIIGTLGVSGAITGSSTVTGQGLVLTAGGSFPNGSIYSDSNYGMAFKSLVAGAVASYTFRTASSNTDMLTISSTGAVTMPGLATSSAATTGTMCWTTGTGNINVDTTTTCLLSSGKYKQFERPLENGLSTVLAMQPKSYWLKPEFNSSGLGEQLGFFAEDVAQIDPRLVAFEADGTPHAVRYQQYSAVLTKGIQELVAIVQEQGERLRVLEARQR